MSASSIAAGAQAFSAFGPWGAAAGALLGAGTDAIAANPPAPQTASAWTDARSAYDGSGWTVATGGSKATGGKSGGLNQSGATVPAAQLPSQIPASYVQAAPQFGADLSTNQAGMSPLLMLLIGGAVLYAIL